MPNTRRQMLVGSILLLLTAGLSGTISRAQPGAPDRFEAQNMFVFGNPLLLVPGAATLIRNDQGIQYRVYTSELMPGEAHTLWIAIFHRPEHCAAGPGQCVPSDLNNPRVQGSLVYGGGYLVGPDGLANFHGSLDVGPPPTGTEVNVPVGLVNGLRNARKAEIHLVVRNHGEVAIGEAAAQLTTFFGGCPLGALGLGCINLQAAIFEAVP